MGVTWSWGIRNITVQRGLDIKLKKRGKGEGGKENNTLTVGVKKEFKGRILKSDLGQGRNKGGQSTVMRKE